MKKLLNIFILSAIILILNSCAKPTVVEIVQPNDDKLSCEELKTEIADVQKIIEEAEFSKDSGGNYARVILFWPAWAQSLHNADEAILAANDRKYHLIKIMPYFHLMDQMNFVSCLLHLVKLNLLYLDLE